MRIIGGDERINKRNFSLFQILHFVEKRFYGQNISCNYTIQLLGEYFS